MAIKYNLMSQLIFKFPFKTKYYDQDYYVSSNNFSTYKLIESWPNWPDKWVNIYGPRGCGKTHLSNILKRKLNSAEIIDASKISDKTISKISKLKCLIIENYNNNIEEKLFYTILNISKQFNIYIVVNTLFPIKNNKLELKDLKSRIDSFVSFGIEMPTDELLRVIISKYFSDKQVEINPRVAEYIIKNIERSYDKVIKIIKEIDELSLS